MGGCGSKAPGSVVEGGQPAAAGKPVAKKSSMTKTGQESADPNKNDDTHTSLSSGREAMEAKDAKDAQDAAAVTRLQAATRGRQGRKVVPPLKQQPCNRYRVNVQAENFGDCLCGWRKAEHADKAFIDTHGTKARRLDSSELRGKMAKKEYNACDEYRINMQAENFGDCICGRPRAEHADSAIKGDKPVTPTIVDAEQVRARFAHNDNIASCKEYRVNMQAANFGECMCGRPKAEHTAEALRGVETERQAVDEEELRKKMTAKEMTTCKEFVLDMDPNAPFAKLCSSLLFFWQDGHTPMKKQTSVELRETMVQKETVDCPHYRLDMDPNAPFGQCACGHPKGRHSAAALSKGSANASRNEAHSFKSSFVRPPPTS